MHRVSSFNHLLSPPSDTAPDTRVLLASKHDGEWKILLRARKNGDDWVFTDFYTTHAALTPEGDTAEPSPETPSDAAFRAVGSFLSSAYPKESMTFHATNPCESGSDDDPQVRHVFAAKVPFQTEVALTKEFTQGRPVWPRLPFVWASVFRLIAVATDPTQAAVRLANPDYMPRNRSFTSPTQTVTASSPTTAALTLNNPYSWLPRRAKESDNAAIKIVCADRTVALDPRFVRLIQTESVLTLLYQLLQNGSVDSSGVSLSPSPSQGSLSLSASNPAASSEISAEASVQEKEKEKADETPSFGSVQESLDVREDYSGGTVNYLKILNNVQLVLPGLFISNYRASCDLEALQKVHGITHVLSVLKTEPPHPKSGITYAIVPEEDVECTNLLQYFEAARMFISAGRQAGGCLVHCMAGISRSATLLLSYLMSEAFLDDRFRASIALLKRARPVVSPNSGFLEQLSLYHNLLQQETYQPLYPKRRYGVLLAADAPESGEELQFALNIESSDGKAESDGSDASKE